MKAREKRLIIRWMKYTVIGWFLFINTPIWTGWLNIEWKETRGEHFIVYSVSSNTPPKEILRRAEYYLVPPEKVRKKIAKNVFFLIDFLNDKWYNIAINTEEVPIC